MGVEAEKAIYYIQNYVSQKVKDKNLSMCERGAYTDVLKYIKSVADVVNKI